MGFVVRDFSHNCGAFFPVRGLPFIQHPVEFYFVGTPVVCKEVLEFCLARDQTLVHLGFPLRQGIEQFFIFGVMGLQGIDVSLCGMFPCEEIVDTC